jgi:hypothetical protein
MDPREINLLLSRGRIDFSRFGMKLMEGIEYGGLRSANSTRLLNLRERNLLSRSAFFTGDNRDNWAVNRQKLIDADPANAASLRAIEEFFIFSLLG